MAIIREVKKANESKLAIVIDIQTVNESKLAITNKYNSLEIDRRQAYTYQRHGITINIVDKPKPAITTADKKEERLRQHTSLN